MRKLPSPPSKNILFGCRMRMVGRLGWRMHNTAECSLLDKEQRSLTRELFDPISASRIQQKHLQRRLGRGQAADGWPSLKRQLDGGLEARTPFQVHFLDVCGHILHSSWNPILPASRRHLHNWLQSRFGSGLSRIVSIRTGQLFSKCHHTSRLAAQRKTATVDHDLLEN